MESVMAGAVGQTERTRLRAGAWLGPYEVVDLLGAGGMGEVYRARDPRLGRDVAIKVLPAPFACDPQRLARFEREAKAIAALNHPNVLTVFDVGVAEADGARVPYVVTELLEGENLRELVRRRAPGQRQLLDFLVQVARGLDAAHTRGLVHRDIKPENVFVTSEGRVKVLDFGLAKLADPVSDNSAAATDAAVTGDGLVVGTVGYMSPEQVRGLAVDARTDIFSLGVVLYELLGGRHPFRRDTTVATLAAILQEEPPELGTQSRAVPPALSGIVRRCLAKPREQRFGSARDLAFALEAMLQAAAGSASLEQLEERGPYPGLSSFTEKDAAHFFGREREASALWERLRTRRLLAVIGPSGAGKTSFVRAGVMASAPAGWGTLHATPGANPPLTLARALTPALAGDAEAVADLLSGVAELIQSGTADRVVDAVRRWRSRHDEALVVLDQFEELFTLNSKEAQQRFASLVGRLASEADVHVLLSLRDDFLIRCSEHAALAPVFESLTPLPSLTPEGLQRAVVEPAKRLGYVFEHDALVTEMVESVEGARGALPLLAFAVSRLWEKRDRDRKLLTRAAYDEIGGVAGALAQHAEATMDRIGLGREALVREIFRNLVTAQGTRAVADRDELLSAFKERQTAEDVLRELVDARLLTSYEVTSEDTGAPSPGEGTAEAGRGSAGSARRIEVVHESLLKAWPRLVRWQAQEEDGAVLRDQLRQAAHLWQEKGRSDDLLWSGTAFQEFELWRGRYPGGLTALEQDFARAMGAKVQRVRRLRRAAVAAAFLAIAVVAIAIAVSRQKAVDAARRSEASKLLAIAQPLLREDPTEALAYATAALDVADSPEARLLAVKALGAGPPAREAVGCHGGGGTDVDVHDAACVGEPSFTADGRWMSAPWMARDVRVWNESGGDPVVLAGHEATNSAPLGAFWSPGDRLVVGTGGAAVRVRVWSLPSGRLERTVEFGTPQWWSDFGRSVFTATALGGTPQAPDALRLRSWPVDGGAPAELGEFALRALHAGVGTLVRDRGSYVYVVGHDIYERPLPFEAGRPARLVGRHPDRVFSIFVRPGGRLSIWAEKAPGVPEVSRWEFGPDGLLVSEPMPRPDTATAAVGLDVSGRWLVERGLLGSNGGRIRVWPRGTLSSARPLELRRSGSWSNAAFAPTPSGDWLVASTANNTSATFWPMRGRYPTIVGDYESNGGPVALSDDGRWLAAGAGVGSSVVRLWSLDGRSLVETPRTVAAPGPPPFKWLALFLDPGSRFVFGLAFSYARGEGSAWLLPLDGTAPRRLATGAADQLYVGAVSPSGRLVAASADVGRPGQRLKLYVWNVETGDAQVLENPRSAAAGAQETGAEGGLNALAFADDRTLYSSGDGGIRRWDLASGRQELVFELAPDVQKGGVIEPSKRTTLGWAPKAKQPDGRGCGPLVVRDLASRSTRTLDSLGACVAVAAADPSLTVAAASGTDGVIRVARVAGGEAHLLTGHQGPVTSLQVSRDLRWLASIGEDRTLRVWPMPDLDQPPLHTLPHEALVAKLRSLTNIRAVRDQKAANGWSIALDRFPGWKDVPSW